MPAQSRKPRTRKGLGPAPAAKRKTGGVKPSYPAKGLSKKRSRMTSAAIKKLKAMKVTSRPARKRTARARRSRKIELTDLAVDKAIRLTFGYSCEYRELVPWQRTAVKDTLKRQNYDISTL